MARIDLTSLPKTRSHANVSKARRRGTRIFRGLAFAIIALYLLTCLVPFLPSDDFWPVAILGMAFPLFFILVLVITITWFILRARLAWIAVLALLLGWQQLHACFAFHFFTPAFSVEKPPKTLRVMLWNVSGWDEKASNGNEAWMSFRNLMMDAIDLDDADVLCLQEFFEPNNSKFFQSNLDALAAKGYKYHHFHVNSVTYSGRRLVGIVILSRYPIIDSAHVGFVNTSHSEGLISADIRVGDKVFRVMSTHLQSGRTNGGKGKNKVDKAENAIARFKLNYEYRTAQAALVKEAIDASPYPVILCGNLGDVPNSYTYFNVRGNLQDAFLKCGAGFGRTFRFVSPTLRLDYIFASQGLRVAQFYKSPVSYSDHYPLLADLSWDD